MLLNVDFSLKARGYRDAVVAYFADLTKRNLPVYLEYGIPEFADQGAEEAIHRLRTIDESRIAGSAPVPVVTETGFTLEVTPFGPMGTLLPSDVDLAPATRMLTTFTPGVKGSSYVCEVTGFDLILKSEHIEYHDAA